MLSLELLLRGQAGRLTGELDTLDFNIIVGSRADTARVQNSVKLLLTKCQR